MKIRIPESDFYPARNEDNIVWVDRGEYPVFCKETPLDGSPVSYVICVGSSEARIMSNFCTEISDPYDYAFKASGNFKIENSEIIFSDGKLVKEPELELKPGDGTENRRYMYVLVRTDMEIQNIIVQSAHAAYESGLAFKNHADRTTIIILQVKSELYLQEAYRNLQNAGIQCTMYKEHTLGLGYTAIGTEALTADQRKLLKKYKLLKVQ